MMFGGNLQDFIVGFLLITPGFLIGLCFHEFGHAWMAVRSGDDTPKMMGRLTLNPLKHLDLMGFITLLFFGFGWAKPVMINPRMVGSAGGKYRNWMIGISLAGIILNLCIATIILIIHAGLCAAFGAAYLRSGVWPTLVFSSFQINLVLAAFNLLPVPPLDGSNLIKALFPRMQWPRAIDRYGMFILMGLLFTGIISGIIGPMLQPFINLFHRVTYNISGVFPWPL